MYRLDKVLDFKMFTSFSAETKSNVLFKSNSIVTIEILKRQMFTSWQVLNRIGTWPTWHLLSFKNFFEYGLENRGVPRVRHDDDDDGDNDDDDDDDDQQLQDCNYMFFKQQKQTNKKQKMKQFCVGKETSNVYLPFFSTFWISGLNAAHILQVSSIHYLSSTKSQDDTREKKISGP